MGLTYYDHGQLAALQRTAVTLLEAKFGTLPQAVRERLEGLSIRQLDQLLATLFKAESLKELGLDDGNQQLLDAAGRPGLCDISLNRNLADNRAVVYNTNHDPNSLS